MLHLNRRNTCCLAAGFAIAVAGSMLTVPAAAAPAGKSPPALGSAFGYSASVGFFGGRPMSAGPAPVVKLPKKGSASPVTASAPAGSVAFGPGTLFSSGAITLSTQGASGSASSSASLQSVGGSPFTADSITSSCTATNGGAASGSVSVANGSVVTATDAAGNPTASMAVPGSPPVGFTIDGSFVLSAGDTETFTWVFDEQITNRDGSLIVNAAHEILHGPTAVGDLIVGQSLCRA